MKKAQKPLSELAQVMKVFPQKLINVDVKTKPELSTIPEISQVIKDIEEQLADTGRVLVRYSGTQNMCRVMVEGPTREDTENYCKKIADVLREKLS
jgi:phosphoglucosamine mutase